MLGIGIGIFGAFGLIAGGLRDKQPEVPPVLQSIGISQIEDAIADPPAAVPSFGLPKRIRIPAIKVNAPVIHVGREDSGVMAAPKKLTDVAWLKTGPRPGDKGNAVMAGHYGAKPGIVFNDLADLKPGDTIFVEDDTGTEIRFIVRLSKLYSPNDPAIEVFKSDGSKAHLNLVTCEGDWVPIQETYTHRRVIFADLAVNEPSPASL